MRAKRSYFSIPAGDTACNKWIEAQSNLSSSIRTIIMDVITRYGITDISSLPVQLADTKVSKTAIADANIEDVSNEDESVNVGTDETINQADVVETEPVETTKPVVTETDATTAKVNAMLDDLM